MRYCDGMNYIHIAIISLVSGLVGMYSQHIVQPPVQMQVGYTVPVQHCTLHLKGISNGQVYGTMAGSGRLIVGNEFVESATFKTFSVPAGPLLTHTITVEIPEHALFVASKKGSKLYPVSSARVRSIPPTNRVYFSTKAEGIAAGFR